MVTAFSNGCKTIIPVESIEDAYQTGLKISQPLYAGERKSIRIDGFDFGNSPFDFTEEKVCNQTIIMTTTNGTIAVRATEKAHCVLIGAFINAKAASQTAKASGKDVLIVCAGTDGAFSLEDTLCAGYLVELFKDQDTELTDAAQGAALMYQAAKSNLTAKTRTSRNGRRLVELRREDEIAYGMQQDITDIVPVYQGKEIKLK
jgi:2-phosphosulfolactate phosphatase